MAKHFTFEEYKEALNGAGPKLKEIILERATHDDGIEFPQLKELVDLAYGNPPHISAKSATGLLPIVLSKYSAKYRNKPFEEVIAECFSEWYTSSTPREFCWTFLRKAGVI